MLVVVHFTFLRVSLKDMGDEPISLLSAFYNDEQVGVTLYVSVEEQCKHKPNSYRHIKDRKFCLHSPISGGSNSRNYNSVMKCWLLKMLH